MSQVIDDRVDALRQRLITTAATPISMGNYKQQMRAYQEMLLEVINILDVVNAQQIDPAILPDLMTKLKAAAAEAPKDAVQGEKETD